MFGWIAKREGLVVKRLVQVFGGNAIVLKKGDNRDMTMNDARKTYRNSNTDNSSPVDSNA